MKETILISIHPEHVEKILSGEKRFEFRKKIPTDTIRRMVIYSTSPVMKVVAVAEIDSTITAKPESVWRRTRHASGITKQRFTKYFDNRDIAHALSIGSVRELANPIPLSTLCCTFVPPQSYRFIDAAFLEELDP
jgi:predicted transcriptional regulator